jgi:two-component sensor histidine kinase
MVRSFRCSTNASANQKKTAKAKKPAARIALVTGPARQGFGRRVIERMIRQLKGNAHFDWRPEGLVCEITLRV